jgi:Domain of unknown function (DUF397)
VDLTDARWRKSSFSGSNGNGSSCVEVAFLPCGTVALRDTKDRARPAHVYSPDSWSHFLTALRTGELHP